MAARTKQDGPRLPADRDAAVDWAYRKFVDGQRLDMQGLAAELGVDRTTLFRWVGSRDALTSTILERLAVGTLERADRLCDVTGPTRTAEVMSAFAKGVIEAGFFRVYLEREGDRALRLLTTRAGTFQASVVAAVEKLIVEHHATSALSFPLEPHDLAYLLVRITESFVYTDLITGEVPSAKNARMAFFALLT